MKWIVQNLAFFEQIFIEINRKISNRWYNDKFCVHPHLWSFPSVYPRQCREIMCCFVGPMWRFSRQWQPWTRTWSHTHRSRLTPVHSGPGPGTKTQLSPGSEARSAPDIGAPDNGALAPRPTTRTATAAHVCYITKPPKLHTAASASMIYLANISPSSTISARYLLWIRFWSLL